MTLQTTGAISLNDIHVEAGGTTGTTATINDSDIRSIANNIPSGQANMNFGFWYGAPFSLGSWPTVSSIKVPVTAAAIGYDKNGDGTGEATFEWSIKHDTANNRIEFKQRVNRGIPSSGTGDTYNYYYYTYSGDVLDNANNSLADWEFKAVWSVTETNNSDPPYTASFTTPEDNGFSSNTWYNISTSTYSPFYEWTVTSTDPDTADASTIAGTVTFYIRCTKSGIAMPFANGYDDSGTKSIDLQASAGEEPTIICLHYDMQVELINGNLQNVNLINVGDMIKTDDGYTRVSKVIKNHMRSGYFIIEDDLKITDDHPIKVNGQWVKAREYVGKKQYITGDVPTVYIETESGEYLTFANGKSWTVSGKYGSL